MGALIVKFDAYSRIEKSMHGMMQEIAKKYPDTFSEIDEFHGSEIFSGSQKWRGLNLGQRFRFSIFNDVFNCVASEDCTVIYQGIDTKRLTERYPLPENPHYLVLKFLLEKVDKHLAKNNEFGIVICDSNSSNADKARYRDMLREIRSIGTGGIFPHRITRIVDTLHFVDSSDSRGIQAIDMATFVHRRRSIHKNKSHDENIFLDSLWSLLEPITQQPFIWRP